MAKMNWDHAARRDRAKGGGPDRYAWPSAKRAQPGPDNTPLPTGDELEAVRAKAQRRLAYQVVKPKGKSAGIRAASQRTAARTLCTHCRQPGAHILITAGANPDGTLKVHMLCSRACAAQAGFPWAGR